MNPINSSLHIPDTQSERDERPPLIQRVGVKDVLSAVRQGRQEGAADGGPMDPGRGAAGHEKGTHMSRFVAWLESAGKPLDPLHAA